MKLDSIHVSFLMAGAVVAGLAFFVWRKGGVAQAAASAGSAAGAAVVDAVGGAASGAVGAVGATVGLPTPDETTTDPDVVRWIIDTHGYYTASKWAGAAALISAAMQPAGSGRPPSADSPAGSALLTAGNWPIDYGIGDGW
jgi:hypothetical protein